MDENELPCYSAESRMFIDRMVFVVVMVVLAFSLYMGAAWAAFQWRNPTANSMSYFRNFWSVATWKRLPEYQPRATR